MTDRMTRIRKLAACTTMLAILSTPYASAHAACRQIDNNIAEQPFLPSVMEITLKGKIGSYMEHELIRDLESNLTMFPGLKTIKIKLNSYGGNVGAGFRIHNYLRGLHKQNGLQVVTQNIMSVRSAALSVYCGGNQRIVSPYSNFMMHDVNFQLDGNYTLSELQNEAEDNKIYQDASKQLVSACTNLTINQVTNFFTEETYLDPDQALELGLAHSITPATYDRTVNIRCMVDTADEKKED